MFKHIIALAAAFFLFLPFVLSAQDTITPEDAKAHIGERKTVCGFVANTYFHAKGRGRPTFINLNRSYPNQIFTALIWGQDRDKFEQPPERFYKGKNICVSGKISSYRNKPQIIVSSPKQIEIQ